MKSLFKQYKISSGWRIMLFLLLINISSSWIYFRFDLTKEKRFTISNTTKSLIKKLDAPLKVTVFLKGDFPSGFKKLANSTEDFLKNLKDANHSKISYNFISPLDAVPGIDSLPYRDTLIAMGAVPINLTVQVSEGQQQQFVFPIATVHYKGKEVLLNLYPEGNQVISQVEINSAEAQLEYQFVKAIAQLINPVKPLVAYAMGNGEPTGPETFSIQESLKDDYQLFTLDLTKQSYIPDTLNVVMIVKPTIPFSEADKFKIDQFIMRGGKVLFFLDALSAEQDSLQLNSQTVAFDRNLNIEDLLFRYGVRINQDLVMDLQCDFLEFIVGGTSENPQTEFLQWNYFPVFQSLPTHIINRGLGLVRGQFVNSIDTVATTGVTKTFLLHSSNNARTIATPALISLNENRIATKDEKFNKSNIPVAAVLEGDFHSLYQYQISVSKKEKMAAAGIPFRESAMSGSKIIVVADGDMVLNDVSQQLGPLPMGWNKFTYSEYVKGTDAGKYFIPAANVKFLQNCLEYLTNTPAVLEAGNKEIILRLLDSKKVRAYRIYWQAFNILLPIFLVILFGIAHHQLRKKKFSV